MYSSGLLTYNRQIRVQGVVPCAQGNIRRCFKFRRWSACGIHPKVGTCKVNEVVPLPNEYIPWVGVHAGLAAAITRVSDALTFYAHAVVPWPACS